MKEYLLTALYYSFFFLSTQAYDDKFILSLGQRYVALAGAAYCTNPIFEDDTVENWTCDACKGKIASSSCLVAKLERMITWFIGFNNVTASSFHNLLTDGNGYVAMDHDANEIIISFSGTNPISIRNWIDDLDFIQTSYPLCPSGCKVHQGFYDTYKSVNDQVIDLLSQYVKAYPSATISITGHSLGSLLKIDLLPSQYIIVITSDRCSSSCSLCR
jgi:hypothetical protein